MTTKNELNPGSQEAIAAGCKPIPGYEGKYEVSRDGRVYSLSWEGGSMRKELKRNISKGSRNKIGYYTVRLHRNKITKTHFCGRLVLMSYIRLPNKGEEMNHIDGNTLNDCKDNLEWLTRSENQKHAIKNGLAQRPINPKTQLGKGKKYLFLHESGDWKFATCPEMQRVYGLDLSYINKMARRVEHYKSYKGWKVIEKPNPGSKEAKYFFCCCPVLDNSHGKGYLGTGNFVISERCKLHWHETISSNGG